MYQKTMESDLLAQLDATADKLAFLSEVSRVLSAALTDSECFHRMMELLVPKFADWASLAVIEMGKTIRRVASKHIDANKDRGLEETLERVIHPKLEDEIGSGQAIRERKSTLCRDSA